MTIVPNREELKVDCEGKITHRFRVFLEELTRIATEMESNITIVQALVGQQPDIQSVRISYDADSGTNGSVGNHDFTPALPARSTITRAFFDVHTAPSSSGSATINFGLSQSGLTSSLIGGSPPYNGGQFSAGFHMCLPLAEDETSWAGPTDGNERKFRVTIGTAAITNFEMDIWLEYITSTQ